MRNKNKKQSHLSQLWQISPLSQRNFTTTVMLASILFWVVIGSWIYLRLHSSYYVTPIESTRHLLMTTYFTQPSSPNPIMAHQKPGWMMLIALYVAMRVLQRALGLFGVGVGFIKKLVRNYGPVVAYALLIYFAVWSYLDNLK